MRLLTYTVMMMTNDVPFCRDVDVVDVCFYIYCHIKSQSIKHQSTCYTSLLLSLVIFCWYYETDLCNWDHYPIMCSSCKGMIVRNMEGWKTKMETLLAVLQTGCYCCFWPPLTTIEGQINCKPSELNYNNKIF
jgi:hypothetical protein